MLLLADENFPFSSFNYLREHGYDIKHIGESDVGIKDEEVIQLVNSLSMILPKLMVKNRK